MNAASEGAPEIRASHADRDCIIDVLNKAAGEGRLSLEELEERIDAAAGARYQSELRELVRDLPEGQVQQPTSAGPLVPRLRAVAQNTPVLHAAWVSIVRAGDWNVPEWLVVEPAWSAVVLNMLEAVPPPGGEIVIEIRGGWGSFVLILPEGWAVDRSELENSSDWASSTTIDALSNPAIGKPLVRLIGDARASRVSVRGERWWDSWLHSRTKN